MHTSNSKDRRDLRERRRAANEIRREVGKSASDEFIVTVPPDNGDEKRYEDIGFTGFASFTKALKHNATNGFVEPYSFKSLLKAIDEGTQAEFNNVKLGGGERLLANPLNAESFQLIGNDSNGARMAAAPRFDSRNTAVDMVERYWMALCRDIRFDQYENSELIKAACADLNNLGFEQEFGFACTPQTIFRGPYAGCADGPHVSQFLLQDVQFGNQTIRQRQRYPKAGLDYMTDLDTWNQVNNGDSNPSGSDILEGERYISTLRDAGQWVHLDFPHQSGLWSTIMLLSQNAAITDASPYANGDIKTSYAFGSLGGPDITIQSGLAGVYGLKHAWFQKWCVHRRLRPEVYAQRLELFRRGILGSSPNTPFSDEKFVSLFGAGADVWRTTTVLDYVLEHNKQQNIAQKRGDQAGTWLLPMGFPEGSPTHPAYPGGHSVFIAAAATVAKAFFKDGPFPCPKVPVDGGEHLGDCYDSLTIHGELNKLIANVTLFRDGAGMHWRTDGTTFGSKTIVETGGNLLGEKLAVSMLRDSKATYAEEVGQFQFQGIGGNTIQV
ncbi:phosphatidic acid phosphatase [Leptothoe kymatousa TAU-MAC 1615]|uniref:Phosphatidic acid phosphatase n=2 Tax=Leptothoe TaxID=2651725 RepID=A0ABS5Y2U9_9CYAN|nr:phosphatidic acid phosphatase [Leptothoe kymatousa TAU-MAC 1615]